MVDGIKEKRGWAASKIDVNGVERNESIFHRRLGVKLLYIVAYSEHRVFSRPLNHHKMRPKLHYHYHNPAEQLRRASTSLAVRPTNINPSNSPFFTPARPRFWLHPHRPSSTSFPPTSPKP